MDEPADSIERDPGLGSEAISWRQAKEGFEAAARKIRRIAHGRDEFDLVDVERSLRMSAITWEHDYLASWSIAERRWKEISAVVATAGGEPYEGFREDQARARAQRQERDDGLASLRQAFKRRISFHLEEARAGRPPSSEADLETAGTAASAGKATIAAPPIAGAVVALRGEEIANSAAAGDASITEADDTLAAIGDHPRTADAAITEADDTIAAAAILPAESAITDSIQVGAESPSTAGVVASFPNRAVWLRSEMIGRGLRTPYQLHQAGGPDVKTIQRILRGNPARWDSLERLATGLSSRGTPVSVDTIPPN